MVFLGPNICEKGVLLSISEEGPRLVPGLRPVVSPPGGRPGPNQSPPARNEIGEKTEIGLGPLQLILILFFFNPPPPAWITLYG